MAVAVAVAEVKVREDQGGPAHVGWEEELLG